MDENQSNTSQPLGAPQANQPLVPNDNLGNDIPVAASPIPNSNTQSNYNQPSENTGNQNLSANGLSQNQESPINYPIPSVNEPNAVNPNIPQTPPLTPPASQQLSSEQQPIQPLQPNQSKMGPADSQSNKKFGLIVGILLAVLIILTTILFIGR